MKAIIIFLVICLTLIAFSWAWAEPIPNNLWQGIVAEAANQGYDGMLAITCCYRNRLDSGLNLGCVGLRRADLATFCTKQGVRVTEQAKMAVEAVFVKNCQDVTGGATHYENIEAFGVPKWAKSMQVTCKVKDHTFYK